VVFAAATALTAILSPLKNSLCRMTNADLVASRLHAEASREDFVVVYPWYFGISFDRYFQGPAAWSTMPPLADHRLHRYDLALARLEEDHAIQPLLDRIAATLRSGHQVWLAGRVEIPPPVHPRVPDLRLPARRNPGWNYAPYLENWQAQIEAFVSDHSTSFALVNPPAPERINANENMDLARASGWREAMDGTNPEPPSDK
jgi:hypothetical protein